MSDLKTNSMPFGVGGPAEPMIESGAPGLLAGILNIPRNLIDKAAQFDPNDIHGSTGRVAPAAAEMALALAGGGAPMAEKGAAGIFGGKLAKTADLRALQEAEQMRMGGKHPDDVWRDTGWMYPPTDNKWRFEVPDNKMRLNFMPEKEHDKAIGSIGSLVEHPELYKAYPNTPFVKAQITKDSVKPTGTGSFGNESTMSNSGWPTIYANAPNKEVASSVTGHELQHFVQRVEDFAPGINPSYYAAQIEKGLKANPALLKGYNFDDVVKRSDDLYHRTAGEVEARNVQERLKLTPQERKILPPWYTQDVPYRDQVVFDPLTEMVRELRKR